MKHSASGPTTDSGRAGPYVPKRGSPTVIVLEVNEVDVKSYVNKDFKKRLMVVIKKVTK